MSGQAVNGLTVHEDIGDSESNSSARCPSDGEATAPDGAHRQPAATSYAERTPKVAVSTEEESGDGGVSTEEQAELRQELQELRLRFAHVRRRCAGLEARLETEGAVLLAASRRREAQLRAAERASQSAVMAAIACRDGVATRVVAMHDKGILRATLLGWRHAVALDRAAAAAATAAAAKARPPPATAQALPQIRSRKELYRMSYEALIDSVLEWQAVASRLGGVEDASGA